MPPPAAQPPKPRTDVRDVFWCYDHLDDPDVTPDLAPSPGAWHQLEWAREHRDRFYSSVFPRALVTLAKESYPRKLPAAATQLTGEQVLEMLADSEGEREWLRLWGVTDELLAEARLLVDKWAKEAGVTLDERCTGALVSFVAEIVQMAVDAAKLNPRAFEKYYVGPSGRRPARTRSTSKAQ
jgi:hypothetical protein